MFVRACLLTSFVCLVTFTTVFATEDAALPAISESSITATSPTSTDESKLPDGAQQPTVNKDGISKRTDPLAFTEWEFQIDIKAFQHEPANKSLDRFDASLKFFALLPHASPKPQSWSGFGTMESAMISRGSHSFQAPHKPVGQYDVQADSYRDHKGKMLQVIVMPKDAVTYSLTTGEVLGTTSILQYILPAATGSGLHGTLKAFAIPETTQAGAVFHCKFDTSAEHTCWYEGKATLKVLGKRVGAFPPQDQLKQTANRQEAGTPLESEQTLAAAGGKAKDAKQTNVSASP